MKKYVFLGGIVVGRFKCGKTGRPSKEEILHKKVLVDCDIVSVMKVTQNGQNGFFKTTAHQPSAHCLKDPTNTGHLHTDPLTTYPLTNRLAIVNLHENRRPDSDNILLNLFHNSKKIIIIIVMNV